MKSYDFLIIGGGIAGTTAAETLRKLKPDSTIGLFDAENHPLYSRIMLTDFCTGEKTEEQITMRRGDFYDQNKIDLIGQEISAIDTSQKTVQSAQGESFNYGKLLLATGVKVKTWDIAGANLAGVVQLQNLEQAKNVTQSASDAKNAVVVGGRFIALDFIDVFAGLKFSTTVVIRGSHLFDPILEEKGGAILQKMLEPFGITFLTNTKCVKILGADKVAGVELDNGDTMPADVVGVGIGVTRNIELAQAAGIKTNEGIITNQNLQTSDPDIYAAGDVAEFPGPDGSLMLGTWRNAMLQGKTAAQNMAGQVTAFHDVPSYTAFLPDKKLLTVVGSADANAESKVLKAEGESYERIFIKNNRLVGAVLLNSHSKLAKITQLIESQAEIPTDL